MSQTVTTFGPGAMIDLPDASVMVGGLDHWAYDSGQPATIVEEARLLASLRRQMDRPPSHLRRPPLQNDRDFGFHPCVTVWDFPEWYVVQKSESLHQGGKRRRLVPRARLEKGRFRDDEGKWQPVVPVRFVRSCSKGHCDDIDWIAFVHHDSDVPCTSPLYIEERGTSGTLADTWIVCGCGEERSMSQAARRELKTLGSCNGRRPWLGPASRELCGEPSRLLVRSASNAYFPQILSVISLPAGDNQLVELVAKLWDKGLKMVAESGVALAVVRTLPDIAVSLKDHTDEAVLAAIEAFQTGGGRDERPVKEAEFAVLTSAGEELGSDVPDGDFFARRMPKAQWKEGYPWMDAFERLVLVHRLREVITQIGFTRFEPVTPELNGEFNSEIDLGVTPAALARDADWLPAVENRGEGIFLQFSEAAITSWLEKPEVKARGEVLLEGFAEKFKKPGGELARPFHGTAFYMVHSFSHLLMTQIALECGYPASSIRERIYAEDGRYGILLYTGSPDAEGTLGGLVSSGRRLPHIVRRALQSAELCSSDPVCAGDRPNPEIQRELLGSACHGCLLVAETSCEHRNCFLDRALVVRTLQRSGCEFFTGYGA